MKLQNHNFYCARHISVSSTHFFPHAALEFSSAGSLFPVYSTPPLHLQFSLLEKGEGEFLSLCEPQPHNASALCCVSICRALKRCAIKTNDTIRCYQYRIHKHSSTFTYILWLICDVYVIMSHRQCPYLCYKKIGIFVRSPVFLVFTVVKMEKQHTGCISYTA